MAFQVPPDQLTNIWEIVLQVTGLIGSIATIILGIVAIWLSLYFYRRSNDVYIALNTMLSRVEASSRTTEVTSTQVTSRLIDGVIGSLQRENLQKIEHPAVLKISEKVDRALQPLPKQAREGAVKDIKKDLENLFLVLRAESAPTAIDYDWGPFVRRINVLETENRFLSVKWLNEKKLSDDPGLREALQVAIKDGIVELYSLKNPKNVEFETTACKLNRQNPIVKKVLGG
jgi:hypothetical protein